MNREHWLDSRPNSISGRVGERTSRPRRGAAHLRRFRARPENVAGQAVHLVVPGAPCVGHHESEAVAAAGDERADKEPALLLPQMRFAASSSRRGGRGMGRERTRPRPR